MDSTIVVPTANGQPNVWRWTDRSLDDFWHTESGTVIGTAFMTWMSARPSSPPVPTKRRVSNAYDPDDVSALAGRSGFASLYPPPVADALDLDDDGMFYVETCADHPGDFVVVTPHRRPVRIRDIPGKLTRRAFVSDFTVRKGRARPCFEHIEHSSNGEKQSYMRILLPICDAIFQVTRVYAVCRSLVGGSNNFDVAAQTATMVD